MLSYSEIKKPPPPADEGANKKNTAKQDQEKIRKIQEKSRACESVYNLKMNRQAVVKPRKSIFDFRTENMRTEGNGKPRQGRVYSEPMAQKKGGLRVDEMIFGVKMASLSCTDDSDKRWPINGASANCMAAMEKLVQPCDNPVEMTKKPLSEILKECFDMKLDCFMDYSGFLHNRCVDTQGFIASNDEMIVLSYRFTTTKMDWVANLSMTSCEWEPENDAELGHAGVFSCMRGWYTKFCTLKHSKPRIHTAYYNNFVYTINDIRKHIIDPLTKDLESKKDKKPRKIYVVGCSLGAAVSQIAYCYILEALYPYLMKPEYKQVERLISVTVGSPRVGDKKFRKYIMGMHENLRPLDRAVICRLVHNNDIVPHAPPSILTFRHLDKMVYITANGKNVMVNPNMNSMFIGVRELGTIYGTIMAQKTIEKQKEMKEKAMRRATTNSVTTASVEFTNRNPLTGETKTAFQQECDDCMEGVKDHMQYFYLTYLEKLQKEQQLLFGEKDCNNNDNTVNGDGNNNDDSEWSAAVLNAGSKKKTNNDNGNIEDGNNNDDSEWPAAVLNAGSKKKEEGEEESAPMTTTAAAGKEGESTTSSSRRSHLGRQLSQSMDLKSTKKEETEGKDDDTSDNDNNDDGNNNDDSEWPASVLNASKKSACSASNGGDDVAAAAAAAASGNRDSSATSSSSSKRSHFGRQLSQAMDLSDKGPTIENTTVDGDERDDDDDDGDDESWPASVLNASKKDDSNEEEKNNNDDDDDEGWPSSVLNASKKSSDGKNDSTATSSSRRSYLGKQLSQALDLSDRGNDANEDIIDDESKQQ